MRHTTGLASIVLSFALSLGGCDCGGTPDPDGGGLDGGPGIDSGPGIDGARPDGAPCITNGATCAVDGECCSNQCDARECVPAGCLAQGLACTAPADCCSDLCEGGFCAPTPDCDAFGVTCTTAADCCSDNCANPAGTPCAAGEACACAPSGGCAAAGDPCTRNDACCNGLCDSTTDTCALVGSCRTAGEPCGTEGFNGSCCSTVCLAGETDVPRCQFLGGCRVQDDLCRTDADCCSGGCAESGRTADGRPILRCANTGSCLPPGEICGGSGGSSNCCPGGGGRTGCEATGAGFSRCFGGGARDCVLGGRACTTGGDPCCTIPPGLDCTEGTPRGQICCLADGEECAFGDLCCGGICAPGTDGVLRCGATCVADAAPCSTDADCCGCACVPDGTGGQVCTNDPALCDPCTGPQLGELCTLEGEACCDGPTVACNAAPALEFRTCIIAP